MFFSIVIFHFDVRAEALASARVVSLASLNRSVVRPNKVRNDCLSSRVQADDVQHAVVVRVGEGEAAARHRPAEMEIVTRR